MALVGLGHEGPEDFLLVIAHPRGFRARYPGRSSAARRLVLAASAVSILAVIPPALAPRAAIAQSCPVISGYVYYDINNNGILEAGEPPIAGSPIELRDAEDGNSGIEGLAFDDDGHLFVAKEKDPARIYELDEDGEILHDTKIEFADDLSALAWNSEDGHLYALSDEEHSLYKLDHDLLIVLDVDLVLA